MYTNVQEQLIFADILSLAKSIGQIKILTWLLTKDTSSGNSLMSLEHLISMLLWIISTEPG